MVPDEEVADVSLVTGKMRNIGLSKDQPETTSSVVLRSEALGMATIPAESAGSSDTLLYKKPLVLIMQPLNIFCRKIQPVACNNNSVFKPHSRIVVCVQTLMGATLNICRII